MPTALITGANRGLGLQIVKKLSNLDWEFYVTARDRASLLQTLRDENVKNPINAFALDLSTLSSTEDFIQNLKKIPVLDSVIHCASPYMTIPFLDTSKEDLIAYSNCSFSDKIIFQESINKLSENLCETTFVVTGAVIGMPTYFGRGQMGLLKDQQRQLAAICDYECKHRNSSVNIKHINLGTFRDIVIDAHAEVSTQYVVDTIVQVIDSPRLYPHSVNIVSAENEEIFGISHTVSETKKYSFSSGL